MVYDNIVFKANTTVQITSEPQTNGAYKNKSVASTNLVSIIVSFFFASAVSVPAMSVRSKRNNQNIQQNIDLKDIVHVLRF